MSYVAGCRINLGGEIKERGDKVTKAELDAAGQGDEDIQNLEKDGALLTQEQYDKEEEKDAE